jgi:hypothetical protein
VREVVLAPITPAAILGSMAVRSRVRAAALKAVNLLRPPDRPAVPPPPVLAVLVAGSPTRARPTLIAAVTLVPIPVSQTERVVAGRRGLMGLAVLAPTTERTARVERATMGPAGQVGQAVPRAVMALNGVQLGLVLAGAGPAVIPAPPARVAITVLVVAGLRRAHTPARQVLRASSSSLTRQD